MYVSDVAPSIAVPFVLLLEVALYHWYETESVIEVVSPETVYEVKFVVSAFAVRVVLPVYCAIVGELVVRVTLVGTVIAYLYGTETVQVTGVELFAVEASVIVTGILPTTFDVTSVASAVV